MASHTRSGFSIVELIIVVSIIAILSVIVVGSVSRQSSFYALQKAAGDLSALLEKAHTRAQNSYNGVKHSVKIASTTATLFEGTTYATSTATNQVVSFDSRITLASTSINGGGDTIIFDKVTGATSNYGTIRFYITNASTSSSTVTIGETGIIQIQ